MPHRTRTRVVLVLLVCLWVFVSPAHANAQLLDAFRTLFTPSVPAAIERGLAPDGNLAQEVERLGDVTLTTLREAQAVVKAAKTLPLAPEKRKTADPSTELNAVLTLFESVGNRTVAAGHLQTKGIPELMRIYETLAKEPDEKKGDDVVRLLIVLAMYYTAEGTDCVLDGVSRQVGEDSLYWDSVFSMYDGAHPEGVRFFRELSEQLPSGPIEAALLRRANLLAGEDDTFKHPFNTDAGVTHLKARLTDRDWELAAQAVMAVVHVDESYRAELFTAATAHPDPRVRLEAARAAAELGEPAAFESLVQFCLDFNTSKSAQAYLEEFDALELIPAEVHEPAFAAKAELSEWLSHSSELGRYPDELRIVDQRELKWFGADTPQLFTILEYVAKSDDPLEPDQHGMGIVGSMTWAYFQPHVDTLQPEDIYAYQCEWEAQINQLIDTVMSLDPEREAAYRDQWNGAPLEDVEFVGEWKFDEVLAYPQEAVACASAKLDGKPGFVMFDGPRSHWYPSEQFHPAVDRYDIPRIHIGRVMLGLDLNVQRQFTPVPELSLPPELVVSEYQKWLAELETGTGERQLEMLSPDSPLDKHFFKYIDALVSTGAADHDQAVEQTFERLIAAARSLPESERANAFDVFSVLGEAFESYAAAAKRTPEEMAVLIAELEPFWDHELGRSLLAKAAFQTGQRDTARRLLEKQIELDAEDRHRGEDADILADIWHSEGKTAEAKELLLSASKQCVYEASRPEYYFEAARIDAQRHLDTYRRLFSASAQAELEEAQLAAPLDELIAAAQKPNE